jgi:mercuric ion binding protein
MRKALIAAAVAVAAITSSTGFAAEKTVTLSVGNMYCANCPYIVKKSLERVPGVANVAVSFRDKTATVIYDDNKTDINALTTATTNSGYPSTPRS